MKSIKPLLFLLTTFLFLASSPLIHAGEVSTDIPENINIKDNYLFYLHGISVELHGPDQYSDLMGKVYEYTKIVKAFANRDFNVISEAREEGTLPKAYAIQVTKQIKVLIEAGVPGKNISVVGHSKGAFTALIAATRTFEPEVNFVILAGCALPDTHDVADVDPRANYEKLINHRARFLSGRFLSLRDKADEWFGSCNEVFAMGDDLNTKEIVVNTGEGHGLFYDPDPQWFDIVVNWIKNPGN